MSDSRWNGRKRGWQPKPDVGVGEGPMDWIGGGLNLWSDPLGMSGMVGQAPQFLQTAQKYVSNLPSFSERPVEAAGGALIGGLIIPQELVKYGAGVQIGRMQQAAENLGVNPVDQEIDVRARARAVDFGPLQRTIQGVVGPKLAPAVDTLIPDSLESFFQPLDSQDRPKTLPPTQGGQNIYDPTTASRRFEAAAPPVAGLAVDLTAGWTGPQAAMKVLAKGAPAARAIVGFDKFSPVESPLLSIGRKLGADNLPQTIADWTRTPAGRTASVLGKFGPTAGLAGAQAATTSGTPDAPVFSTPWFAKAGERALVGGILGMTLTAAGMGAMTLATAKSTNGLVRINSAWSPELQTFVRGHNDSTLLAGTGSAGPIAYPGGTLGYTINKIKDQLTDALAGLKGTERTAVARRESGLALTDARAELPVHTQALEHLKTNDLVNFKAEHETAEQSFIAAQQTRDTLANEVKFAQQDMKRAKAAGAPNFAPYEANLRQAQADLAKASAKVDELEPLAKTARREYLDIDRQRQWMEDRVRLLQEASDQGLTGKVPYHDLFGRLAQSMNGLDGERQLMAKDFQKSFWSGTKTEQVEIPNLDRTPGAPPKVTVTREYGVNLKTENEQYNLFRRAFWMKVRASKGTPTVIHVDPATGLRTIIEGNEAGVVQADAMLQEFVHSGLRNDQTTVNRFLNTIRKETEYSNQYLVRLRDEGFFTDADLNALLANPMYIRAQPIGEMLVSWNDTSKLMAQRLFAPARGVEHERTADIAFTVTPQDILDRNHNLIQLIRQNQVTKGLVRTVRADPMGLGREVTKHVPEEEAYLKTWVGRSGELQAEQIRVNRERAMLSRKTIGTPGAPGKVTRRLNTAEKNLQKAKDEFDRYTTSGANIRAGQAQKRITNWTAKRDAARVEMQTAVDRQAQLTERRNVLAEELSRVQQHEKKAAFAAPQAAWKQSIEAKQNRIATLTQQANDTDALAAAASTPKKQAALVARATHLREQIDKAQTSLQKLQTGGMPDPLPSSTVKTGYKVIPVFENGAPEIWQVPQYLHDYLIGVGTPQSDLFTRSMNSVFGKFWRASVTTYSASFAARNLVRDFQTALVNYAGMRSIPEFLGHYVKGLADVFGTVGGRSLEDVFRAAGEMTGSQSAGKVADNLDRLIRMRSDTEKMYRASGGMGTFTEQGGVDVAWPLQLVRKLGLLGELPARVAIFKHELANPDRVVSALEAAYQSRTVTTDFSQAGHAMRVANLFMPLLNARAQGELQTWNGFRENPQGFLTRLTATVTMPYVMSYVWNRTRFGDMLDMIPPDILARNAPLIIGSWFNDKTQREEPIYFKFPLTDVAAGVTIPMRYLLDDQYHRETESGAALPPGQRSVWTPGGGLRQALAGFIPSSPQPNEMDPMGILWSGVQMNPLLAVGSGLMSNWDRFRGRPIADEEAGVLWDQYRWAHPDASVMSQVGAEILTSLGVGKGTISPARVDFALRGFGGGLMQPPYSQVADVIAKDVHDRLYGGPLPSQTHLTPEQTANLPAAYAQYLTQNSMPDNRPDIVKNIGFLYGAGGNAEAIRAKVKQDDPRKIEAWDQTLALQNAWHEYDVFEYEPRKKEILSHTEWSHAKLNDAMTTLSKQRQEARNVLRERRFPQAITDPAKRREFLDSLPGIPVGADTVEGLMMLPPGTDVKALTQRFMQPPGIAPGVFQSLGPMQQEEMQNRELEAIARELSQKNNIPVSPDSVKRAISAQQRGIELPALPLPELYVDDWLDRWKTPTGFNEGDPPEKIRAERELELAKIVTDYDVVGEMRRAGTLDPNQDAQKQAEQAVMETINTRFLPPGEVNGLEVSRDRAYALSAFIRSNDEIPAFVDEDGKVQGTPDEQVNWTHMLQNADAHGGPKNRWPAELKLLDRWRSYSETLKVNELYNSKDYLDYSRWFGVGRTMSQDQWEQFQSGEIPKYTKNGRPDGQAIDPGQALQFDHIVAQYRALPDGREKRALQWQVKRIKRMAVPNWQKALDVYELLPDKQRTLQDDLQELDSQREQEQALYAQRLANVEALG